MNLTTMNVVVVVVFFSVNITIVVVTFLCKSIFFLFSQFTGFFQNCVTASIFVSNYSNDAMIDVAIGIGFVYDMIPKGYFVYSRFFLLLFFFLSHFRLPLQ